MEYTVLKLAMLSGVSSRTLRYYDEIGLLSPARINTAGYRIYGQKEVDKLQQILFYKELGMALESIKGILNRPDFNMLDSLIEHKEDLILKRRQLDVLISNVEKTIANYEGRIKITDMEKFEGFKKRMIDENEKKYGGEVREKYGDKAVNISNKKFMDMSKKDYEKTKILENDLYETLKSAMDTNDPTGKIAQRAADLHRQWLMIYWDVYNKESHSMLAQMYVEDERFKKFYDDIRPGMAEFLKEAILNYVNNIS